MGFLLVYSVNSKFLLVGSELDTGFALFCFLGNMEKTHCVHLLFKMCPGVPYRFANRVGDRVSLFTVCLETQNIFAAGTFSPVISL